MKKWLTFLLLLVTLAATFYPCCSKDDCGNDELATKTADHENHESKGNCSPFITCGTCSGFTQMATHLEMPPVRAGMPVHHSRVSLVIPSSYIASLFQPPQVA